MPLCSWRITCLPCTISGLGYILGFKVYIRVYVNPEPRSALSLLNRHVQQVPCTVCDGRVGHAYHAIAKNTFELTYIGQF